MLRNILLSVLLLHLNWAPRVLGQEGDDAYAEIPVIVYSWDGNGTPVAQTHHIVVQEFYKAQMLLEQAEVQRELELTGSQVRDLESLRGKASRHWPKLNDPSDRGEMSSWNVLKIRQENLKERDQILLPHQIDRLSQIENRIEMRHLGMVPYLVQNSGDWEMELDERQVNGLRERLKLRFQEATPEILEALSAMEEEIASTLTDAQRRTLDAHVRYQQGVFPIENIDIVRAQWQYALDRDVPNTVPIDDPMRRHLVVFSAAPEFSTGIDGQFAGQPCGQNVTSFWLNEFRLISHELREPLPIPADDRDALKLQFSDMKEAVCGIFESHKLDPNASELEKKTAEMSQRTAVEEMWEQWIQSFPKTMSPEGRTAFFDYYEARCSRQYGKIGSLLIGPLSHELQLILQLHDELRPAPCRLLGARTRWHVSTLMPAARACRGGPRAGTRCC